MSDKTKPKGYGSDIDAESGIGRETIVSRASKVVFSNNENYLARSFRRDKSAPDGRRFQSLVTEVR